MRHFAAYLTAGILVLLATNLVALPVSLGLSVVAQPVTERGETTQFVDRTLKADRLRVPATVGGERSLETPPAKLIGCDPPYSPLLTSARIDAPGRCVAGISAPAMG